MNINIRHFRSGDAAALAALMHASIHDARNAAYSTAQKVAWSPCPISPEGFLARVTDGRMLWVAQDRQGQPIGFIELEKTGHIDCFYCFPSRKGTGAALYEALETEAKAQHISSLFVEASEAARQLFRRVGFRDEMRVDFTRNGVALHNYRMTKAL